MTTEPCGCQVSSQDTTSDGSRVRFSIVPCAWHRENVEKGIQMNVVGDVDRVTGKVTHVNLQEDYVIQIARIRSAAAPSNDVKEGEKS